MSRKANLFILSIYFLFIMPANSWSQAIYPLYYWSFNSKDVGKDEKVGKLLDTNYYKCSYSLISGKTDKAIDLNNANCPVRTGVMKSNIVDEFSIELFFKGTSLTFLTFSQQLLIVRFSYGGFLFRTSVMSSSGKIISDDLKVELKGSGRQSYDYYTDDEWHHLVFTASLKSGKKEIWVDGESLEGFSKSIPAGEKFEFGPSDGFKNTDQIDELAFYNKALPPELINQHFMEASGGKSYTFSINKKNNVVFKKSVLEVPGIDPKEFAPGYPDYSVQATDQLKQFPLPRYASGISMSRNFPWMDINYLHRELPQNGGKGFGKINPKTAVRLTEELAKNWNYYIELPTLRTDEATAKKKYNSSTDIFSSLIHYANANPQLPAATVLMQVQNNPVHAGFDRTSPYVSAKNLEDKYYLSNKDGKAIVYSNKKWLSPFSSMELVRKDGLTSAFYIKQLAQYLTRKINIFNENGEWFGHKWPQQLLQQSPEVASFIKKRGMDYEHFNGWMQNRFDSVYKTTILNNIPWKNVSFTFYNVSAYNSAYWPEYKERIRTNSLFDGTIRSTPAFYPARPDNWRLSTGSQNGYGTIAEGRQKEIALGVKFFAPFISAGWALEENNIRPAQWLSLLKAMVMLGADFFHVGYFNVTGKKGWPDGVGPNDPRGYIYQAAMPAYAQAIGSRIRDFIVNGELLNPQTGVLANTYRFAAKQENHLVMVRKLGKKYLIYGSIQPNSNIKGNIQESIITSIHLNDLDIKFQIRRQGSMYILDLSDLHPVFYQLDSWHQYEHPYFWSEKQKVEAEICEKQYDSKIKTENILGSDFANFTTFARVADKGYLIFDLYKRNSLPYSCSINIRSVSSSGKVIISAGPNKIQKIINHKNWQVLKLNSSELASLQLEKNSVMKVSAGEDPIDIDWVIF